MACFRLFNRGLINRGVVWQTCNESFFCGRTTCIGSTNFRENRTGEKKFSSYEGDGKTVAYVLDKRRVVTLCVKSVSPDGFKLHNDMQIVGSAIFFPYTLFSWNVQSIDDVTEESLTLFKVMEPKLDLLIFGYGRYKEYTPDRRIRFHNMFKKLGLRYEALPTEQAIGTFNFLCEEFRHVAGAFIPPSVIDPLKLEESMALLDKYDDDDNDDDDKDAEEKELKKLISPIKSSDIKALK